MNIGELIAGIDQISGSQSSLRLVKQLVFDMAYEGSLLADLDKSLWIHFDLDSAMDDCRNGLTYKNSPESGGLPITRIESISDGTINLSKVGYASLTMESHGKYLMNSGDILLSHINSMEQLGKVAIYNDSMGPLLHGMNLIRITPNKEYSPEFLFFLLKSSQVKSQVRSKAKMAVNQASINIKELKSIVIPCPPIDHQNKSVERIKELLSIIELLEEALGRREALSQAFRRSSLDSISTAQSPSEFRVAWERIQNHWDLIAGTTEGIQALRGLILDFAVSGRLVSTKNQSTDQVMRDKNLGESPWSLFAPRDWNLFRLQDACEKISDGTHKTPRYQEAGVPFLSIKDISGGHIDFSRTRFISSSEHEELCKRIRPARGDVLFCRIGTLGKAIKIETDTEFSIFVSLGLLRPKPLLSSKFLELALNSPISTKQLESIKAGGSHAQKLNLSSMRSYVIWFPDLKSQAEIVQQVSDLMELCDELEKRVIEKDQRAEQFARSVLSA
jgi:type I restriction enzyme S subunit